MSMITLRGQSHRITGLMELTPLDIAAVTAAMKQDCASDALRHMLCTFIPTGEDYFRGVDLIELLRITNDLLPIVQRDTLEMARTLKAFREALTGAVVGARKVFEPK